MATQQIRNIINSQIARTYAYTSTMFTDGGGMKDAVALELGLFPSKNQREWSNWLYGKKKKRRKRCSKKYAYGIWLTSFWGSYSSRTY